MRPGIFGYDPFYALHARTNEKQTFSIRLTTVLSIGAASVKNTYFYIISNFFKLIMLLDYKSLPGQKPDPGSGPIHGVIPNGYRSFSNWSSTLSDRPSIIRSIKFYHLAMAAWSHWQPVKFVHQGVHKQSVIHWETPFSSRWNTPGTGPTPPLLMTYFFIHQLYSFFLPSEHFETTFK